MTVEMHESAAPAQARRFVLRRDEDVSGVSGTGIVCEGIQFSDGKVAMRWTSTTASTCAYDSIEDVAAIHGHGGKTRVSWIDVPGQTWCNGKLGEGKQWPGKSAVRRTSGEHDRKNPRSNYGNLRPSASNDRKKIATSTSVPRHCRTAPRPKVGAGNEAI